MKKRAIVIAVLLVAALPAAGLGVQRFGRGRAGARAFAGAGVTPAQVWRLTSLTMKQRVELHEIQMSAFERLRDARDGGNADRSALVEAVRDVTSRMARVLTPEQLEAARARPRTPLTPEDLIYYPVTSLEGLDPARRAKIDAIFKPALAAATNDRGDAERQHRIALFEVLGALLSDDQMVAVKQFLPEQLRNAGLRERIIYRLPTLTLEQEAQARAVFAALEDETAADRARQKAIKSELDGVGGDRQKLVGERRQIDERISAREKQAYEALAKVLTPEQMKALAAEKPGPPRPLVFTPEAIRSLANLTPEQQRRLRDAMQSFQRETADERREVRDLRGQAKGADLQSMEMAGVRDQLRRAALVLDVERDKIVRLVADTLTGEQLAQLVATASRAKRREAKATEARP